MKRLAFRITSMLLTFILLGVTETFAQTYERTFSFTFTKEDIEISKSGEGYYVRPNKVEILWSYLDEAPNKPAFPYLRYYILLPDNYKVKSFNHSVEDEMWYDGEYTLNAVPLPIPTDEGNMNKEDDSPYPLVTYPAEIICYEETLMDGYRTAHFLINPFTYHADIKKLGLATNMNLDITIEPVDKDEEVNRPKEPASVKSWVYNPEDVDMEAENWIPNSIANDKAITLEGKEWNLSHVMPQIVNYVYDIKQWIDGDTLVDGQPCKKLYTLTTTKDERIAQKEVLKVGYCRQEGDKFYKNGTLMFDFGLKEGDVFSFGEEDTYAIVTHVGDTTLTDGVTRRCLTLRHYHPEWDIIAAASDKWIEGIGSLEMGVYSNLFMNSGYKTTLLSCTHNNTVIYEKGNNDIDRMEYILKRPAVTIQTISQTLLCTSPTAVKLEVYTMDAIKVGEADFANGEATVKVDNVPATYLYIVTYPNGRRESGKVMMK